MNARRAKLLILISFVTLGFVSCIRNNGQELFVDGSSIELSGDETQKISVNKKRYTGLYWKNGKIDLKNCTVDLYFTLTNIKTKKVIKAPWMKGQLNPLRKYDLRVWGNFGLALHPDCSEENADVEVGLYSPLRSK